MFDWFRKKKKDEAVERPSRPDEVRAGSKTADYPAANPPALSGFREDEGEGEGEVDFSEAFLFEEEYCRLQILPKKAREACEKEIKRMQASDNDIDPSNEWQYEDEEFDDKPVVESKLEITAEKLASVCDRYFTRFETVLMMDSGYEDEDIDEEDLNVRDDVMAFGVLDEESGEIGFTLFAELDEDSDGLGNVWFEVLPDAGSKTHAVVVDFLADLSGKSPMIFVDWDQYTIIPLEDRDALDNYFEELSFVEE